jgi:hypothetical protein
MHQHRLDRVVASVTSHHHVGAHGSADRPKRAVPSDPRCLLDASVLGRCQRRHVDPRDLAAETVALGRRSDVIRVAGRLGPKLVVDVPDDDPPLRTVEQCSHDVQQTKRVSPARNGHHDRSPGAEQAGAFEDQAACFEDPTDRISAQRVHRGSAASPAARELGPAPQ